MPIKPPCPFLAAGSEPWPLVGAGSARFGPCRTSSIAWSRLRACCSLEGTTVAAAAKPATAADAEDEALLKQMMGELTPTDGMVKRHQHLRIGWYHQHLQELLDMTLTPLEFMIKSFPDTQLGEQGFRRVLGTFGISGNLQSTPMNVMSDGQKSRVVIAHLAFRQPHMLLLDEPTNHLDLETIDALAEGIRNFEGGLVLVSHDFRLINQVAKEIWEVKNGVHKWAGDIISYKKHLAAQIDAHRAKQTAKR